jgi:thiol-disulfide isomerase/thioredoxin
MRLLFAALLLSSVAGHAIAATATKPTLSVKTLDGGAFDLSKQNGKWVIVNFWATWCSPCLKELPDISKYVETHKDKVSAIGLAFEDSDKQDIINYLKQHPISYPVAQVDINDPPKDFETPKGLPNTYVVAPDGHIAKAFMGPITMADLDAVVGK